MTSKKKPSVLDAPALSLKDILPKAVAVEPETETVKEVNSLSDLNFQFFWLITATVDIKAPNAQNDDDAHVGPQRINFPLSTEDGNIRNHTLSVIRGLAAHGVVGRLGLPTTRIASVIIDNITALGFMLEQDFFGVPEATPAPEVVDDAGATQPFVEG